MKRKGMKREQEQRNVDKDREKVIKIEKIEEDRESKKKAID